MSGLNSLLKYRYQKRTLESSSVQSSPNSASNTSTQDSSDADLPKLATGDLSTSPIFPAKRATGSTMSKSEHTASKGCSKGIDPNETAGLSPWLSKKNRMNEDVETKKNGKRRNVPCISSSDDEDSLNSASSSSLSSTTDHRDLQAKVNRLADMFPDVERSRLEEAINFAGGHLDSAVDHVINHKNKAEEAAQQRKRKLAFFSSSTVANPDKLIIQPPVIDKISPNSPIVSPDCSPCNPPALKRARPLSFSDESPSSSQNDTTKTEQTTTTSHTQPAASLQNRIPPTLFYQNGTNVTITPAASCSNQAGPSASSNHVVSANHVASVQQSTDSEPVMDFQAVEERIAFLSEAFPNISKRELKRVLTVCKFDVEQSSLTLASYQAQAREPVRRQVAVITTSAAPVAAAPPPPLVSQTTNVGSIKAFFASRQQAKVVAAANVSPEPVADNQVKKIARQRVIMESDSEDEAVVKTAEKDDTTKTTNQLILNFFNDATVDEMTIMNGCSRKKAELVVKMRPFQDFNDLMSKIENSQSLPQFLISECRDVIRLRNTVHGLMERCQRLSTEQEKFLSELTNKTSMDGFENDQRYVVKQPKLLSSSMSLTPYQLVGLNWLILMHSHDLNGILGDEMGLGKTVQTIAFFAHLSAKGVKGPHVVVAPSSTIDNWLRELKTWCPSLNVLLYYGSQEERRAMREDLLSGNMDDFEIMLTTYNMASGATDDRTLFKKLKFNYAVFDEGHMLKNMTSLRYKSLMRISSRRRLLLTGTPLQNNLLELMSLLAFLMPDMFAGKTDILKRIFSTFTNSGDNRGTYELETLCQAKEILRPFFLRRLKSEVLQQLPKKIASVVRVPMSFEQQDLYDELLAKFARELDNEQQGDKAQSGSSMMMSLRKAANHHLLHRRQFDDSRLRQMAELMIEEPTHRDSNVTYIFEDMQVMSDFELHRLCCQYRVLHPFQLDSEMITDSGKFRHLDELLPGVKSKGDRVLLFSQFTMMLDIVEEYMKSRGHIYIRLDGSTPVAERQELIDTFNTDSSIFVFLLSTKAGGLGINLTAASVVVLHDIDFNPYNDKQAEDRCHRIGQTKDVTIFRLISKSSIEEAMLKCAEAKLQLEMDVTGANKGEDDIDSNDVAALLKEALQMGSKS